MNEYLPLIRGAAGVPEVRSRIAWSEIEAELGLSLPEDYEELLEGLPPGRFNDQFIDVRHPIFAGSSDRFVSGLKEFLGALKEGRDLEKALGDKAATHLAVYPEAGGILPWGRVEDDWIFAWKTAGEPSKWKSVAVSFEFNELYPLPGSMSQALYRLIIGDTGVEELDYLSEMQNFVQD
ncbi:hypothetical protein AB0I55_22360 [Actinocatenispora sera]|uniref:hypothetical protein n=1 Tax=Actinocatenispora sera TaxID=390989 RepID=UPI0033E4B670